MCNNCDCNCGQGHTWPRPSQARRREDGGGVVGSDMLPGSRNIDKKEFVKLEHVAVNNGLVLLDEIKGKNMCKKEVLAG